MDKRGKIRVSLVVLLNILLLMVILHARRSESFSPEEKINFTSKQNQTQSNTSEVDNNRAIMFDTEILKEFNNNSKVSVLVRLKDTPNFVFTGTKEERRAISRQRDEWFKPVIDEVLATLSKDEFRFIGKLSNGFGGWITKKEFGIGEKS